MDKKIELHETTGTDAELICNWLKAKENVKHMSSFVRETRHTVKSILNSIIDKSDDEILFTIKIDGIAIGHAGFEEIDDVNNTAEIYFLIGDEKYQGKGLGKEIVKELIKFGFEKLNLNNIFATVSIENIPSIKSIERGGFKKIGIRREYNNINGRRVDEILFDIIKKDYINSK